MNPKEYLNSVFGLEGKTIMITGAGGGIGLAISEGLAYAGAEIALCNRTVSKCQPLADQVNADGGCASVHALDITNLDSIQSCVDEVVAKYGKIDVLFNVAGINKREGLLDVEESTYDRIMDTNLKGLFFMSQAVGREMYKRKEGNIINIGSHNDEGMLGGCSVYGATKSGVVALTRSMAVEFAQYGIRCNAISPGHILTELTQVTWDHPTRSVYLKDRIAMGRPGNPDELVGMAIMLASDASRYMTGQAYHVDGGCLCGGAPWEYDTAY
ncbi:MAG: SDR family oxidoreductase [Lachnospiraceae bacterium]|nr:SDR family oxidoreductase [Lachnospiraceae bacterium]